MTRIYALRMSKLRGSAHAREGSVVAQYDAAQWTLDQITEDLKSRARHWSAVHVTVWRGGVCIFEEVIDCG